MSEDRGVSEVLGYVLVISIVTVTIAVVLTMGIGGLEAAQQSEEINNMERAFDVLAYNAQQLIDERSPHRATEFRIGDGSVRLGDPIVISVYVDGELIENESVTVQPIVYEHQNGAQIVYESGAVIRSDDAGAHMLSEPRMADHDDHLIVHGIRTRASGHSANQVSESGTMLLRKERIRTDRVFTGVNESSDIELVIESPRADAWDHYLESQAFVNGTDLDGEVVTAELTVDEETELSFLRSVLRVTLSE